MQELRSEVRPRRSSPSSQPAETVGRLSPWALFGVIAGAVACAAVLLWVVGMAGVGAMIGGYSAEAERQVKAVTVARPVVSSRVVTVPSKSVAECKAETGGVVNEHFARCRRGYQYTETTRR